MGTRSMNWPLWAPLLIGLVLAGWLIAALVAILRGMSMQKSAAKSQRQLRRVARLLEEARASCRSWMSMA